MNSRTAALGTEPTHKVLTRLALPATAGLVINALYNIVDSVFVGRFVGTEGLAAVGLNFPLQIFLVSMGILVGVGSAAQISRRLGAGQTGDASRAFGSATTLILIIGGLIMLLGILLVNPVTRVLGASGEMLPLARQYFSIIVLGAPLLIANQALNNIVYSEGAGAVGFFALAFSSLMNIALDWMFIGRLGMGIPGAAWATIISQGAATVLIIGYFASPKSQLPLRICICWDDMKETLRVGFSAAIRTTSIVFLSLVVNRAAFRAEGDVGIAVASVVFRIVSFVILPAFGINQAFLPIVAFNYGAGKFDRMVRATWQAIVMAIVVCSAVSIGIAVFSEGIARAFSEDPTFLRIAARGFRRTFILTPLIIFNLVAAGLYQAVGDARRSLLVALSRMAFFFLPLLLVLPRFFGMDGIWGSFPLGELLAAAFALLIALPHLRQLLAQARQNLRPADAPA